MALIVAAYTALPPPDPGRPASDLDFLVGLAATPEVRGLELPFNGALPTDDPRILGATDPRWDFVVTSFPGTMLRVSETPEFGLASTDEPGRAAALAFTEALRQSVLRLNDWASRPAVLAVEIHSAPTRTADPSAFTESLCEVASWDWGGALVTVEHCDAPQQATQPAHEPQKGFLSLADEIAAVRAAADGRKVGVTINWARSAIEGRDARTVQRHLHLATEAGLLAGLMFSGCADTDTAFGPAWLDAHLPPTAGDDPDFADLDALAGPSLLTPSRVRESLVAAGSGLLFTGLKIGLRPETLDTAARLAHLRQAIDLVERAR